MKIFRAVPRDGFNQDKVYKWRDDSRLPGNVPYLVDNLWEFARPEGRPSRRRAVFASPTAALTLGGASAGGLSPDQYIPCELIFSVPMPATFQLSVTDARYHPDVGRLPKLVNSELARWSESGLERKLELAPLFLPGTTAAELSTAMQGSQKLRELVEKAAAAVTMWSDIPDPSKGEISFELGKDHSYTLIPV